MWSVFGAMYTANTYVELQSRLLGDVCSPDGELLGTGHNATKVRQ
jgi:hypothetical protein